MTTPFQSVCMVGQGYIGLPTAVVFAKAGTRMIGFDIDQRAVDKINAGETHIVEPGLDQALSLVVRSGFLRATTTPEPADAFLIAVPTPFLENDGRHDPDLSYVEAAARTIAPVLKPGDLVILESTSPVGATESVAQWLAEERPDLSFPQNAGAASDIRIAHCPERILPGRALEELVTNDRIIGGMTPACATRARQLYELAVRGQCIETDCRTAELAKLTENSFRDVNIAFANELSLICDRLGINVWELIRLANRHPRVNILQPGPGVGGHCIAIDPWFIVSQAPEEARIIRTAREINDAKPEWVLSRVRAEIAEWQAQNPGATPRVACFGLAFKANIDDLRESPALSIARRLATEPGIALQVVEPYVEALPAGLGAATLVSAQQASAEADICVLLVDHDQFRATRPNTHRLIDTRGAWKS